MSKKKPEKRTTVESCEAILAVLKASQRQLEYLAHEHLSFKQVLRLEEGIRVGGSPERAEIQRMRLLLDARIDHVRQMRALTSLAPLTFTPSDDERIEQLRKIETISDRSTKEPEAPVVEAIEPAAPAVEAVEPVAPAVETIEPAVPVVEAAPEEDQAPTVETVDSEPPELKTEEETTPSLPSVPPQQEEVIPIAASPIPLGGLTEAPAATSQGLSVQITPASEAPPQAPPSSLDNDLKSLMRSATKAHGDGELERAIESYTDLLDQAHEHGPALLARGRCYLEKKDFSAAISDFRRAQKAAPSSPDPLVALGDLHFARRDHPQAIVHFDEAISMESNHAQARCRRGMAHYHSGRFRQAFLDLQRAYKLDPEIPNIRRLVQMAIRKLEESG